MTNRIPYTFPIFDGDDVATLNPTDPGYAEAYAEAEKRAKKITVVAPVRKIAARVLNENPPRDGNDGDAVVGRNRETYPDALVRAGIIEHPFASAEELDNFLDDLSEGQFKEIFDVVRGLSTMGIVAPKEPESSSSDTLSADETSSSPAA